MKVNKLLLFANATSNRMKSWHDGSNLNTINKLKNHYIQEDYNNKDKLITFKRSSFINTIISNHRFKRTYGIKSYYERSMIDGLYTPINTKQISNIESKYWYQTIHLKAKLFRANFTDALKLKEIKKDRRILLAKKFVFFQALDKKNQLKLLSGMTGELIDNLTRCNLYIRNLITTDPEFENIKTKLYQTRIICNIDPLIYLNDMDEYHLANGTLDVVKNRRCRDILELRDSERIWFFSEKITSKCRILMMLTDDIFLDILRKMQPLDLYMIGMWCADIKFRFILLSSWNSVALKRYKLGYLQYLAKTDDLKRIDCVKQQYDLNVFNETILKYGGFKCSLRHYSFYNKIDYTVRTHNDNLRKQIGILMHYDNYEYTCAFLATTCERRRSYETLALVYEVISSNVLPSRKPDGFITALLDFILKNYELFGDLHHSHVKEIITWSKIIFNEYDSKLLAHLCCRLYNPKQSFTQFSYLQMIYNNDLEIDNNSDDCWWTIKNHKKLIDNKEENILSVSYPILNFDEGESSIYEK